LSDGLIAGLIAGLLGGVPGGWALPYSMEFPVKCERQSHSSAPACASETGSTAVGRRGRRSIFTFAAEIGKGTVYLHWSSKLDLFAAVLVREVVQLTAAHLAALRADPAEIQLHRTLRNIFLLVMRRPLARAFYSADVVDLHREQPVRPGAEQRAVVGGQAEQLGDDDDGQREGERVDEVVPVPGPVEQLAGQRADTRLEVGDGPRREGTDTLRDLPPTTDFGPSSGSDEAAMADITAYLGGACSARRTAPRADLISRLVTTEVDGRVLDEEEAANFSTVLLGNAVRTFDEHPGTWDELRADATLIPGALEEVLRFRSPFVQVGRATTEPARLSDTDVPADVFVLPWVLSANRDPRAHRNPDRFDIRRGLGGGAQLAFGHGVHFCLGAPLARLEGRVALEELTRRYRRLSLDHDAVAAAGGLQHFPRGILGTRNLPIVAAS
jgi:AcrR family transcriptional regulator